MNINGNTILITGGSAGIGLSLAKEFLKHDNTVIICGRNKEKLEKAKQENPQLHTIVCDVTDDESISRMIEETLDKHPSLNMLVNNAGTMHIHDVVNGSLALKHQKNEIMTNFFAVVALCDKLLPQLLKQKESTILNISSGLAYMPFLASPVYTATKAAVHSYSLSMRGALKGTPVKVFEALPPMVDTEMTENMEMEGMTKISSERLAEIIVNKMKKGKLEIRPGQAAMMIRMYKLMPGIIDKMMAKKAPEMLKNIPRY